uniref:Uncharacterized protein n=1 Tax=Candidatus Kentrum sp. MB TaxID=2138164 RepID=A0A450XRZ9_9GAMM|nr:MAG: hypothetical protein BECKMB1821G_GA0114241_110113 [Candidatus Kentron sp. MB]VFK35129.1 MAG: hypothetical protein BECKMB1821I_GA0114274_110114 [Candidatus Kentron sp. MB]VFK76992.1 MAG: hypothetical protein BECKMB1821H_GA0114242_108814 [Candidatus Kentron sp. MB]
MSKNRPMQADVDPLDSVRMGEESAGDFTEVGKEVAPGMRLRCICRGHTGIIGRHIVTFPENPEQNDQKIRETQ